MTQYARQPTLEDYYYNYFALHPRVRMKCQQGRSTVGEFSRIFDWLPGEQILTPAEIQGFINAVSVGPVPGGELIDEEDMEDMEDTNPFAIIAKPVLDLATNIGSKLYNTLFAPPYGRLKESFANLDFLQGLKESDKYIIASGPFVIIATALTDVLPRNHAESKEAADGRTRLLRLAILPLQECAKAAALKNGRPLNRYYSITLSERINAIQASTNAHLATLRKQLAELGKNSRDSHARQSAYVVNSQLDKLDEVLTFLWSKSRELALNKVTTSLLQLASIEQYAAKCAADASRAYVAWQQTQNASSGYIIGSVITVVGGAGISLGMTATSLTIVGMAISFTGFGLIAGIVLLAIALACFTVNYFYNRSVENGRNNQYEMINHMYQEVANTKDVDDNGKERFSDILSIAPPTVVSSAQDLPSVKNLSFENDYFASPNEVKIEVPHNPIR